MAKAVIRFCRDCANFEDRRDIDDIALCKRNQGPNACCEEFEPRDEGVNKDRLYNKFCSECANFQEIDGTPICAKNHTPGVACEEYVDRFDVLNATRQSNNMKIALMAHAIKSYSNPEPLPETLIKIGRKMKW